MGVIGFLGWLSWTCPDATGKTPPWNKYRGKKIGIDILGFLYKAKTRRQSTMLYVARLVAACRKHGITPVPIFDGRPPSAKLPLIEERALVRHDAEERRTVLEHDLKTVTMSEQQRNRVVSEVNRLNTASIYLTSEERELIKQLFYVCGIRPLNACGEADPVLAYLSKSGDLAAVISNDMDLLARGVETLLVPEPYALPGDESGWSTYTLSSVCETTELSYNQLVEMCVLMGCDYTHGGVRIPYKTAYWLIKHHSTMYHVLHDRNVTDTHIYQDAVRILKGDNDTPDMLMNERQWLKWTSPPCDVELDILYSLRPTILKSLSNADFQILHYGNFPPNAVVPPIPAVRNTIQNVPTDNRNRIRNKIADRSI
jgi:flap endonuclease-1